MSSEKPSELWADENDDTGEIEHAVIEEARLKHIVESGELVYGDPKTPLEERKKDWRVIDYDSNKVYLRKEVNDPSVVALERSESRAYFFKMQHED